MVNKKILKVILAWLLTVSIIAVVPRCNIATRAGQPSTSSNVKEYFTPSGQRLTPAGTLLSYGTPDWEQHAMDCKLSPDGKILAVEGRYYLVLISTTTKRIKSAVRLKDKSMYEGITWAKDGKHIYWTTSRGKILEATINENGTVSISKFFEFPKENNRPALPNDIKISEDKKYMYVILNGANKIAKIDIKNKNIVWEKSTNGKFPYGLCLANGKLYVTNWGGRIPDANEQNTDKAGWNDSNNNETIVINPKTESAVSGTVSILNPETGEVMSTIDVGLHPNDIIASKNGDKVYIANANSDNVSVIDTDTDSIAETITVSPNKVPFGASPNALALAPDGKFLFVADGLINSVAVVKIGKDAVDANIADKVKRSKIVGFIPTGAYPGGLDIAPNGKTLFVANTEGLLATATTVDTNDAAFKLFHSKQGQQNVSTAKMYNTHRQLGYISIVDLPNELNENNLAEYTKKTLADMDYAAIKKGLDRLILTPRPNAKPVPIPERLGEPSVFKHVIYIIKENRSYDQIFGDMKEGNGNPNLTVFGEKVTPNQHQLAKKFELLDNFYDLGKCSAEGHPWTDSGYITDYIEKNVRGWFRGYPHVILDAMVTPKTGYIWDDVLNHNLTFKNYGESVEAELPENATWASIYKAYLNNQTISFENYETLNNLVAHTSNSYPGYDGHKIQDVLRAREFIKELKKSTDETFPNFVIMALPADHTAGLKTGYPAPRAMVADNDEALGRIVDAVSHSPIWKDTAIFVIEDDTQDGWDHVSAYRGPALVISPYSRLHKVIHTFYNQLSVLHTIEKILGIPPMNLMDLTAPIMYDCFTDKPEFTPYNYIPHKIALNEMNPSPKKLSGKARYWSKMAQKMSMKLDDPANDNKLNKMIWYSVKGFNVPYPEKYTNPEATYNDDK